MFKKISLGLMMFLVFGMFSGFSVQKVQAADLACTIEYPDGRIEDGTWINGTCQPNGSIAISSDYKVNVKPVSFFDKLKLAFTFNAEKKAALLADFSNRNFELAKQEFKIGNITEANIFLQKSEENTEKAEDSASKIKDEEKKQEVQNSISVTASNRTAVLMEVKAKIENATAKEAIQDAIDKQIEIKSSVDEKKDALIDLKLNSDVKVDEEEKSGSTGTSTSAGVSTGATVTLPVLSGAGISTTPSKTGEWGDDVNGRHIGYIKSVSGSTSATSAFSLKIDYIQWVLCGPNELGEGLCMNGFEIVNDNPQLRNLQISNNVVITTANQDSQGNPIHPTISEFQTFISQAESSGANYVPYWITLNNSVVTEIKFQYVP